MVRAWSRSPSRVPAQWPRRTCPETVVWSWLRTGRYHVPPPPAGDCLCGRSRSVLVPGGHPLIRMELQRHQNDAPSIRLWLWVTAIELVLIVVLLRLAS